LLCSCFSWSLMTLFFCFFLFWFSWGVFFTIWNKSALFLFCYFFLLGLGILFFF
jgi:hypothetical protein